MTDTQIVAILKQAEAGTKVQDICREHGISNATYYQWKSKYGGLEASDLKRLKEIKAENSRLKRMYADLALENQAIKDLLGKLRRRPISAMPLGLSSRRGCQLRELCYRPALAARLVPAGSQRTTA